MIPYYSSNAASGTSSKCLRNKSFRRVLYPSSITRWRKRIGEAGVERLLRKSIDAARRGKVVKEKSFDKVIVDTTVMQKAIAYPTDSQLLEKGRQHLVKLASSLGIALRQNYNREAPRLYVTFGGCANRHADQSHP